jgi:predicted nucleic acid-binding protein
MTAIDSNVLVGLLNADDSLNLAAKRALQRAAGKGRLVVSAPVFVELSAMPKDSQWSLDGFLRKVGIDVDWLMDESIWRAAASANASYVARRRKSFAFPRRAAADFLIGAHALQRGAELLTLDQRTFRVAFPNLKFAEV